MTPTAVSSRCTATWSWASSRDKTGGPHRRDRKTEKEGVKLDTELTAEDWKELVGEFKAKIKKETGNDFPEDPKEQLWGAIGAVFKSWNNPRAITYRKLNNIPDDWGTAVNVQAMVFGNMGEDLGHRRGLHPRPRHRRGQSSSANT